MKNTKEIKIHELISQAGKHLRNEFENLKQTNPHYGERGTESEIILTKFLNDHLPKRFSADTGLIIDYENQISSQIDVIVYDALNSPIYRKGPKVSIIPIDNVAVAIEVKSKLNKPQLEDAAQKIASVKKLKKSPLTPVDQPVTFSNFINTSTLGVVFAYETDRTLETLAKNLLDINNTIPSNLWLDLIVVLDKGLVNYAIQSPFEHEFGIFGGISDDEFIIVPWYIHLVTSDAGEFTLNKFFLRLIAHLTFFRKISTIDFNSLLGSKESYSKTLGAYQFDLKRKLKKIDKFHSSGNFVPFSVPFNIYSPKEKKFVGQITWIPWQDGCFITYSCKMPPELFFIPLENFLQTKIRLIPASKQANIIMTQLLPLKKEDFINFYSNLKGPFILEKQNPANDIKYKL